MATGKPTVAFIGFGETGQAIASGLREAGIESIAAWDILFPVPEGENLKIPPQRSACAAPRL